MMGAHRCSQYSARYTYRLKMNLPAAIGSVMLAEGAGLIGTFFTIHAIPAWYAYLSKPSFSPPNWLFGPVWTILYLLMGIAAYRIWSCQKSASRQKALSAYFVQLALNALWTPVFFGLHALGLGLIIICAMCIAILITIFRFWRIDRTAAYLLCPYIAWVSFATALNIVLLMLN
jgi:benzodiazapine receptor